MGDPQGGMNTHDRVRFWNDRAALIRHILFGGSIIVAGVVAWVNLGRDVEGIEKGLHDHSRELEGIKGRTTTLEFRLADGTNAAQTRTDSRVQNVETFVQEQRGLNATITEQNRATKEAVKDIQAEMKAMQNQMSGISGNINLILNSLQRREAKEKLEGR